MPTATSKTAATTDKGFTAQVFDVAGKEVRSVELAAGLFGVTANPTLISEVIVSAQANRRHAIANTLTRGEIRGGGKKPWRQKGTGRARQGSTRAPHWRHGGVVFGPTSERNFSRKINKQAREAVIRMLLSNLREADQVRLIDGLSFASTKLTAQFLNGTATTARRPMLLTATANPELLRVARNLDGVMVRSLERLGLLDLALTDQLILDVAALEPLTARYGKQTADSQQTVATKPAVKKAKKPQTDEVSHE